MKHPLAQLASTAVNKFISNNKTIDPPANLPEEFLSKRAGTFVTITEHGELRGCIGTYLPVKDNVALEVIANAISAATDDPRFEPLSEKDLAGLSYEVYILEEPVTIKSLDELDPKKFGVIVFGSKSHRSALLLPGLEGINTAKQQLGCVTRKAGIDPTREKLMIQKFRAEKFH
jgi:AmmeMemoRadiSam system protein A